MFRELGAYSNVSLYHFYLFYEAAPIGRRLWTLEEDLLLRFS